MNGTTCQSSRCGDHRSHVRMLAWVLALTPLVAQTQQTADPVAPILRQANAKLAAGAAETVVEAWMQDALRDRVQQLRRAPPTWDVYAQAQWRHLEREAAVAQDMRRPPSASASVLLQATEPGSAPTTELPVLTQAVGTAVIESASEPIDLPATTKVPTALISRSTRSQPNGGPPTSEP
jgi:hypothetical protein